ncbi:MAG: NAD-dependent malic enzyme, partial [Rhodococcus sp. (in: high G+C Gram-positive bacteria)]
MPSPSPGYSITVRVHAPVGAGTTSTLAAAIASVKGAMTALDVVESHSDHMVIDITCDASDVAHADQIATAIAEVPGVVVGKVSDRTFLLHLGGKLEVVPTVPLKHRDDLSRAYTPGVARVCTAIAEHPEDVRRLTIKRNTVAVVTDGSAVLGLGNIG